MRSNGDWTVSRREPAEPDYARTLLGTNHSQIAVQMLSHRRTLVAASGGCALDGRALKCHVFSFAESA